MIVPQLRQHSLVALQGAPESAFSFIKVKCKSLKAWSG